MPRRHDPDPPLPQLTLLSQARSAGMTVHQVRQRLRTGEWWSAGRGAYAQVNTGVLLSELDGFDRARAEHVFRSVAAALRNPGSVVTDASAALCRGLAVHRIPQHVQLAVPPDHWTGSRSGIDFRAREFEDDEVNVQRVPIASALRSWVDITRFGSLVESLVTGDSGARNGLFDSPIETIDVDRWRGRWGGRRIRLAAPLVDGTRESPLESWSFAYFIECGLPLPSMQVEIRTDSGRFIARVDFFWEQYGLIGEADGKLKYLEPGDLFAEKRREDALRAEGLRVVRWGAADLRGPDLARTLSRLLR